ncbi:type II secretion system protein [Fusobacterium sp.]|uniref:type II secretion system protein n=1 Tax=Fusobacterium sp. TaxID=68766 RepID=UPI00396CA659
MKNKGFSLIEVCIGIALVGIMVGIGGPKIRKYIASAKDTKAIATMGALRTASELYYSENDCPVYVKEEDSTDITGALAKLEDYLDRKTFNNIKTGKIEVGGYSDGAGNITYGGEIPLSFNNPDAQGAQGDGVYIWFFPGENQQFDIKGKKWSEY